jgi:23S rRNA pseudouridine2605 synthase
VPRRAGGRAEAPEKSDSAPQRIAKLLARAGVASRREVERMIAEGRIALNGEKLTTPATILDSLSGVTVDGKPVRPAAATRLFRFYKPQATITAARDPKGRATIYDRLPNGLPRLMPIGRLDFMTEGLLLLTNDGELKRQAELPSNGVVRTYRARAHGRVKQAQLEKLAEGMTIEGVRYGSINANLERRTGSNCWVELSLAEGKNREVRRVLGHLGLQVSRLIRTAYGPLTLEGLDPGHVDEVPEAALEALRRSIG